MADWQRASPPANGALERRLTWIESRLWRIEDSHGRMEENHEQLRDTVENMHRMAFLIVASIAGSAMLLLVNIVINKTLG